MPIFLTNEDGKFIIGETGKFLIYEESTQATARERFVVLPRTISFIVKD